MLADDGTSDRSIVVYAVTGDGTDPDPYYRGDVTLTVDQNGLPAGAKFAGPTDHLTVTASGGVATFTPITLNTAGSSYALHAASPTLTSATTTPTFNVYTATRLVFHTQPIDTRDDAHMRVFNPTSDFDVVVYAVTGAGTVPDPYYRGDVTLTVDQNGLPAGAKFAGPTDHLTEAAVAGIATFTPITLNTPGSGYALHASSPTLASAISNTFRVYTATNLFFNVQPVNDEVGQPMRDPGTTTTRTIRVYARNADNTLDVNYYGPVTLTLTGGNASANFINASNQHVASLTVNAVAGVAAFTPMAIDLASTTSYQLRAGSRDLMNGASTYFPSNTFIVSPPASQLIFQVQPVDVEVNTNMRAIGAGADLVITVGAYANDGTTLAAYYDSPVTLSLIGGSNGAHFSGLTQPTNFENGLASYSPINIDKTGFNYQLRAVTTPLTGPAVTRATSGTFLVAGDATVCQTNGGGCTANTANNGTNGDSASIKGKEGNVAFLITGTFGANVDPMSCSKSAPANILTFTGVGLKVITVTIPASAVSKGAITEFCYGQPDPFLAKGFKQAKKVTTSSGLEYQGILPPCAPQPKEVPPCLLSTSWKKGQPEIAVIHSATSDPHLAH
jgi:hypothetical protein